MTKKRLSQMEQRAGALDDARAEADGRLGLLPTVDDILRRLWREATRTGEGSSPSARVAALKLLGQHLGMFVKKVELTGPNGSPVPLSLKEMSDEDLDALIRAAEAEGEKLERAIEELQAKAS